MIILAKILAFILITGISFAIARKGKVKMIGFKWSLYFSFLNPILGLLMTLFSRRYNGTRLRENFFIKVTAVIFFLYGMYLLLQALSMTDNSNYKQYKENAWEREFNSIPKVETGNSTVDFFIDEFANRMALSLGGGILTLTIETAENTVNNYRYRRILKTNGGILLISLGVFLLRNKRRIIPMQSQDGNLNAKNLKQILMIINVDIESLLRNRRFIRLNEFAAISIVEGIIFGWVYRQPKLKLMDILMETPSEWAKELVIEYYKKKSDFFSTEFFYMNWQVFFIVSLAFFFILIFLFDQPFRQFLYDKLTFKEERNNIL